MRINAVAIAVAVAFAAAPAAAAPVPSFSLSSIISTVLKDIGINLNEITVPAASKHGNTFNVFATWTKYLEKQVASKLYTHKLSWNKFAGWSSYKSNGVNLGAWLEIETNYAPGVIPSEYQDEWSWCGAVGAATCGPVLEAHYDSYVTKADIDKVAKYGVNTLRIPTTYAAWAVVPGSQLYHGQQQAKLKAISEYAISKHGMHVVIGLHSLPGGVNGLEIGEAFGHAGWWYNQTNFDSSIVVVTAVLDFIKATANPSQYTLEAINEPGDTGLAHFGSTTTVSYPDGVNYLNTYLKTVYALIAKKGMKTTLMVADAFMGASYWAPYWTKGDNIVFDSHFYYFAADGIYSAYVPGVICGQAAAAPVGVNFPIFVGEWSLQTYYGNNLTARATIFQTELYAWQKYMSGGAFWNIKYLSETPVASGEGGIEDYWSFENLIDAGVIPLGGAVLNSTYC